MGGVAASKQDCKQSRLRHGVNTDCDFLFALAKEELLGIIEVNQSEADAYESARVSQEENM